MNDKSSVPKKKWYVYILQCKDNSLYTGITTDLTRRLEEHNSSDKGARYTRSRRPVKLKFSEVLESRSTASKRESAIKKLTRNDKISLISRHTSKD